MEAYLNGIAWDYIQANDVSKLSNRKRKLLEDTFSVSIRDKLTKYPQIISGHNLWQVDKNQVLLTGFLRIAKPFRDSLVHPSPFSAPEKFGGYDKLKKVYRIDYATALVIVNLLVELIELIHSQVCNENEMLPEWFVQLKSDVRNTRNTVRKLITAR
jgi:hypothetical protein